MPRRYILLGMIGCALAAAGPGFGQRRGGGVRQAAPKPPKAPHPANSPGAKSPGPRTPAAPPTAIDEFVKMSPEERDKALAKLAPERAEKLQKQIKEYSQLSPPQQAAAREQLERLRQLPPERQQAVRKAFDKFSHAPPERQEAMRQELSQFRGLSPSEREQRMSGADFKQRFSGAEQKMLREISNVMPED